MYTALAFLSELGYSMNKRRGCRSGGMADALDSKSSGAYPPCGFNPHLRHQRQKFNFAKKNVGNRYSYSLSDRSLGGHGREEKGIQSS